MPYNSSIGTIPHRRRDGTLRSETLVDDDTFAQVGHLRWSDSHGYAMRVVTKDGVRNVTWLHRLVAGLEPGEPREADHRNGDTYDCRRSNLRIVTHLENSQNRAERPAVTRKTSKHRGVCWNKRRGAWVAQVFSGGKCHWLGYFGSEEAAAVVARQARVRLLPGALD